MALRYETACPSCNTRIRLQSALHRYIVIAIVFGCAVVVGLMVNSDGGDFLVGHLLGFFLGVVLASAYLHHFGRVHAA